MRVQGEPCNSWGECLLVLIVIMLMFASVPFLGENIGIEKKNIITININTCIFKSLKLCDHLVSCVTLSCVKLWKIFYQLWQNQRTSVLTSNIIVHNFCDTL